MNPRGKFIDSVILKNNTQNIYTQRLISMSDGYIALSAISSRFDSRRFFSVTRFDNRLKSVKDTLILVSGLGTLPSWAFDRDSNIIVIQKAAVPDNYFGKIDKNGTVKFWKTDTSYLGISSNSLIVRKDSLLYTAFFNPIFRTFDTAFNVVHETSFVAGYLSIGSTVTPLSDSTVCIAGKGQNQSSGWQHSFAIRKLSGAAIFSNIYMINSDSAIWGGNINSSDTTKLGEWYWGGTYNYPSGARGISSVSSYFLLHKLNKNYSTKWTKRYGGDAYYEMYGVLAKDDGGCLMYGTRYDYNNTPKYDAYIINVDADGVITSESSIPLNMPTITAYLNPSNGQLSFKVPPSVFGQIDLAVFDISGKLVYQRKEAALSETFDLSNLPNGNYLYQIFQEGTPLSVGKWVKTF